MPLEPDPPPGRLFDLLTLDLNHQFLQLNIGYIDQHIKVPLKLQTEPIPTTPQNHAPSILVEIDDHHVHHQTIQHNIAQKLLKNHTLRRYIATLHKIDTNFVLTAEAV